MLIELLNGLSIRPISPGSSGATILKHSSPILGRQIKKFLKRASTIIDGIHHFFHWIWKLCKRFLRCLKIFLSLQAPAKCIGVEDAVGVRRWNVVCRGLVSTAAFRFLI